MAPLLSVTSHSMAWFSLMLCSANGSALLRGTEVAGEPKDQDHRRDYSFQVGPLPSTAPVAPQDANDAACPTVVFDTIVIGGGMAGLSASHILKEKGKTFVLLERSASVGGRMRSTQFGGQTVEMGANWIAGGGGKGETNPILALAEEFDISSVDHSSSSVAGYEKASSERLKTKDVETEVNNYWEAIACLDSISQEEWGTSIASDFTSAPNATSARNALSQQCDWATPANGTFTEALETLYMENEFLLSPEKLSTYNFREATFNDFGSQYLFVTDPEGMQSIAEKFASTRKLLNDIHFNKEVTMVDYQQAPPVVSTRDTLSGATCEYKARTVILTPSAAVIKRMDFNPPLDPGPNTSPLDINSWVKIFYKFDSVFWDTDAPYIVIGTEKRGECAIWINYGEQVYPGSGIIFCVTDQATIDNCVRDSGEQTLTKQIAKDVLLNPLRAAYGEANVPEPADVLITDWKNDPTSYGSWETFPEGKDLTGYYNFFNSRDDTLFISGSGSCLRYWGTMHGAYLAGERDAKWAINAMDGDSTVPYNWCDDMGEIRPY